MAKSSSSPDKKLSAAGAASASSCAGKKRQRKAVKVVVCPSAFPDFTSIGGSSPPPRSAPTQRGNDRSSRGPDRDSRGKTYSSADVDFEEAIREVHALGSTAFAGKQARKHKQTQYKELTGRDMKRQKVPLPIARGIKKKRAEREARAEAEAKEAGVVRDSSKSKAVKKAKTYSEERRKSDSMKAAYGPSPDVGYMKGGVLRVKKTSRGRR